MVAAAVDDDAIVRFSGFGLAPVLIDTLSVYVPGATVMMTSLKLIFATAALIEDSHPSVRPRLTQKNSKPRFLEQKPGGQSGTVPDALSTA
jgi:hypothetical protein